MAETPPEAATSDATTVGGDRRDRGTAETGSGGGDSLVRAVLGMGRRPPPVALVAGELIDETYRIVRTLGSGGMGVVYLARDVRLGRDVAIKLHAAGAAATARGVERLIREASAIAQLSHGNVVTVYQVDTYDGHPFVAMEYVDGGTARSWLASSTRGWREVLTLYLAAGRGLAAAHRAGLVHRDFKPDNVLVGRDGRVRVADFGLVQGEVPTSSQDHDHDHDRDPDHDDDHDHARLTRTGAVMGTPAYMAPEQHRGEAVGAAADQFAFCVSLWEALCGTRPFTGGDGAALRAAIDTGRIGEPPADRKVPRRIRRALERGLAADPAARFASMDALLHELAIDPAAARRKLAIALAALTAVGGGAAAFALTRGDDPAARCGDGAARLAGVWDGARRGAVEAAFLATGKPHAADTFARTAAVLDRYADGWVNARVEACQATHARHEQTPQLLDLRYHCLDRRRAGLGALAAVFTAGPDPDVLDRAVTAALRLDRLDDCADLPTLSGAPPRPADPAVRDEITRLDAVVAEGRALHAAGKFEPSLALATGAVEAARATGYPPLIASALRLLAAAQSSAGDHPAAKLTGRQAALAAAEAHDDRAAAEVAIFLLHLTATQTHELEEAEALVPVTKAAVTRAGSTPTQVVGLDSVLGVLRHEQGRFAESRALLEQALVVADRELGPDDVDTANLLNRLANLLARQDALDDARRYLERAIALQAQMLGAEHPHLAMSLHNLGGVLLRAGKHEEALAVFQRALAMKEKLLGADHRDVATTLTHLGVALRSLGRYQEARPYLQRALAIAEASFPAGHPTVARALINYAGVLNALGSPAEAIPPLERGLAMLEEAKGVDSPDLTDTLIELGGMRSSAGDRAGAHVVLERARTILIKSFGPDHPDVAAALGSLADLLVSGGKLDEALRQYRQALAITIKARGEDFPQVAMLRAAIGFAMIEQRDWAGARRHLEEAEAGFAGTVGVEHPQVARCLYGQAQVDLETGEPAAGIARLERALAMYQKAYAADHPDVVDIASALAGARARFPR